MSPVTTATEVASSRPSGPEDVQRLQDVHHEAVVGQDRLPGQRAHQEAGEERRDHHHQHEVLPAAGLERDRVGERVGQQQRETGRHAGVQQGPQERRLERLQRVPVVRERPGHRVAGVERAVGVVERRGDQLDRRDEEEHDQPEHAGQQQPVARLRTPAGRRLRLRAQRALGLQRGLDDAHCGGSGQRGVGLVAGVRVLVGVEQERVRGDPVQVDRVAGAERVPGPAVLLEDRELLAPGHPDEVLRAHADEADVADRAAAEPVAAVGGLGAGAGRGTPSPGGRRATRSRSVRRARATGRRPCCRARRPRRCRRRAPPPRP